MAQSLNPVPYQTPIISGKNGLVSNQWANWFRQLFINSGQSGLTNPMTSLGDMIFGGIGGSASRLPGNTSRTKQFLSQTGLGTGSSQPVWGPLLSDDIPDNAANTTGSAGSLTQSIAQFQLVMGEGVGAGVGALGSIGTAGQFLQSNGAGMAPSWANNPGALIPFGTRPNPILITASGGITPNAVQRQLIRIAGSGGAVTIMASTPMSAGAVDGQELILEGSSASNTVTINSGSGLEFGGTMILGTGDKIAFLWEAVAGVWTEMWRFYSGITGGIFTDNSGNPFTDNAGNTFGNG